MREILFRGKTPMTDRWVFGTGLLYDGINTWIVNNPIGQAIAFGETKAIVVPETVGQYTGLTDKNGKKIFEGDVVKDRCGNSYVVKYGRYDILCCGCCYGSHDSMGFYLCNQHNYALSEENVWDYLEIIGNIHHNPELPKEGADNDFCSHGERRAEE